MPQGAHDWFRPRLLALVADAAKAGYGQDVAVAVITDLMNGPLASASVPPADEDWNRDIGEPDSAVNGAPASAPETGPDYASSVSNPLQHLGHNRRTTRPR